MKNKKTMWFKGALWGWIENGELTLSPESKLDLIKENNRRIRERALDLEISKLLRNAPPTL